MVARDGVVALNFLFGTGEHAGRDINHTAGAGAARFELPRIDGFEVLKRLRADPRTRLLPVVILTSSREQQDIVQGTTWAPLVMCASPSISGNSSKWKQLGFYWLVLNESCEYRNT